MKEWMNRDAEKPLGEKTNVYFRNQVYTNSDLKSALASSVIKRDVNTLSPKERFYGDSV